MRSFAAVLALFAAALVGAALLAYPAWLLVGLIDDQPIHRVMHRIAMLLVLFGLVWLVRRWQLADRQSLGLDLPRRQLWRQIGVGIVAGVLVILPLIATLYALDVRIAKPDLDVTAILAIKLVAAGLATGLVVALIEETFFRGVLFTAIRRESGATLAVVLPSLLYASVHFLGGRLHVPAHEIEWSSGPAVLGAMFIKYGDPAAIVDSFLALFAVGVLLALVRLRTGSIAACIGLHAAWVCVIAYTRETTLLQRTADANWLVGSYDGILGWGALGWMAVMAVLYVLVMRNMQSHGQSRAALDARREA